MNKNSGNIEPLLVLCCLVGVVAFFCISLAFSAALGDKAAEDKIATEHDQLSDELKKKEHLLRDLALQIQELETKIQEKKKSIDTARQPQIDAERLEKELLALSKEREALKKRIDSLRRQLSALEVKADPRNKEEKEKELIELARQVEQLDRTIKEKRQTVVSLPAQPEDHGAGYDERQKRAIEKEIERTHEHVRNMENQIKALRVKIITGGASSHKNPLYVECRKDVYVFYPKGEAVGTAEIEKRDLIAERISGHDIVVLIVRPDGFGSFNKIYGRAQKLGVALCYEPLEAHQSLDFLRG
jgi:predicted  nucleic acid-binding Zn-ribbon protein